MAYDPAQDTIRERILDNVETTLRSIQGGPTYYHRVRKVHRFLGNMAEFTSFPAIAVVPGLTRSDDRRLAMIEHTLPITLLLMVDTQDWAQKIEKLCADVRVALLADWTRGGVALTTRGTGEDIQDSEPSSPLGSARVDVEVLYRTLYHNPGAAI
jgi:hypothetical protein